MDNTNYSLSDIASVANAGGNGGNMLWLLLFFIIFGYGNGNRTGEFSQFATASSQNEILLGQKFDALGNKINSIGDGICSSTYALNNAILGEGRSMQTQLANIGAEHQASIAQVRYDMANFASSINSNINDKFAALEKNQMQAQISAQAAQINQLQMSQALCGIPRINPNAYGVYSYAPSCGCNCGNM